MQIFITGASGFVGGAATEALLADGHQVFAMSRSESSDQLIRRLGATPVRCDLQSVTSSALQGCEAVIHCAAYVEPWGPKHVWYDANVIGTKNVVAAAKAAGVKRFIHIGTEAAICYGQNVLNADESEPLALDSPYPYCSTKALAEQHVLSENSDVFQTLSMRPRFIWGPGDKTLLPIIEEMAASGKWMWINDGKAETSTTHIANLVHAITLSLTEGQGGEAYFILDDGTISLKEMISGMAASKGLALADKSVPMGLADFVGKSCERIWRLLNIKSQPPLTAHAAMVMSRDCVLNGDKAARELGYRPVIERTQGLEALTSDI
ncbi:MAG: NAD-dependent epimerase/dehydratase family protein [Pseudomonadota bacterium]